MDYFFHVISTYDKNTLIELISEHKINKKHDKSNIHLLKMNNNVQ